MRSTEYVEDKLFSEDEVFTILSLIEPSKACGPDYIPGRLFKEGVPGSLNHLLLSSINHSSRGSWRLTGPVPMSLLYTRREVSMTPRTIDL